MDFNGYSLHDFQIVLKPVDLAYLQILRRFWYVARRGKGGKIIDGLPWIRVTASDMVGYFAREGVIVSEGTISRSLRRLETAGRLQRKQLFLARWDHRYWYTPPSQGDHFDHPAVFENAPSLKVSRSNQASDSVVPAGTDSKRGSCDVLKADRQLAESLAGPQEALGGHSSFEGDGLHQDGLRTSLDAPGRHSGVMVEQGATWDRVRMLAAKFDEACLEAVSPKAVLVGGRLMKVDDGACAPLR